MVDPVIAGVAVTAAGIVAAAAYSYFTGNEASVDTDNDGEDELTFGGGEDESTFGIDEASGTSFETKEQPEDPTPETVEDKDGLEDVKGVGGTRAAALSDAGFETPADLYYASDDSLLDVHGIGDLTVSQIREDIGSVEDEGNDGESDEEPEEASQDSEDQESTSEQSDSNESTSPSNTEESDTSESDGSDSGETTDSTGSESDDER